MIHPLFLSTAMQAQQADTEASRALSSASTANSEVSLMRADIEKLLMISEALWTMLKEQHGYSDDDLFNKIQEIDMQDGRADGRVAPKPREACPSCGRILISHRPVCLYCGQGVYRDPFDR